MRLNTNGPGRPGPRRSDAPSVGRPERMGMDRRQRPGSVTEVTRLRFDDPIPSTPWPSAQNEIPIERITVH